MSDNTMIVNDSPRMPMIGDPAPAFRAMTTMGKVNFPEDYKGSWVVLFSHPADFTPVCTTEFIEFTRMTEEFAAVNTKLIGLSIDSLHSHLAWAKSIEGIDWDGKGKVKLTFPIIADISMEVARKYGMLQTVAKTQTVRAVFVIDPEGIIRGILYYPMSTGRNIPEILRMVKSLQFHDENDVSTPVNWQPGTPAVMGAPLTLAEAEARMDGSDASLVPVDWYLTLKK
ncbi:peroxiredoxin [Eubacterium sp. AB3007]|uniref:peroxiredoxin n=1 Tax=Eubacterium sp. AB3007 TaxID=1392487 RepID=UPI000A997ABA|nr:peroxiredoxin [Eubacterium sp. AB3007]